MKKFLCCLVVFFMANSLSIYGMSKAEELWSEIVEKLNNGHFPSSELLAEFKKQEGSDILINRPYGGQDQDQGGEGPITLLFGATLIVINTWYAKINDKTFDTLSWVNSNLNRPIEMLYSYGARMEDDEKRVISDNYKRLVMVIKRMRNNFVSRQLEGLAALLRKIGVDVKA